MISFSDQLASVQDKLFGPPETVTIIIDDCNLQLSALAQMGMRLDYQAICSCILDGHRRASTLPQIITDATEGIEFFQNAMKVQGYEVKVIASKRIAGQMKNLTDPYIHQALYEAGDSETDTVALVSGDGDFEPALDYIKQIKGKSVEVYARRDTLSMELYAVANDFVYLDDMVGKCFA